MHGRNRAEIHLPGEGLQILVKVRLLLLLLLLLLVLLHLLLRLHLLCQLQMQWVTPGPERHIASSGCCAPHLGPNTILPAQDDVECARARTTRCQKECQNTRKNVRIDARENVRIDAR